VVVRTAHARADGATELQRGRVGVRGAPGRRRGKPTTRGPGRLAAGAAKQRRATLATSEVCRAGGVASQRRGTADQRRAALAGRSDGAAVEAPGAGLRSMLVLLCKVVAAAWAFDSDENLSSSEIICV
jgi:hypothetical protein